MTPPLGIGWEIWISVAALAIAIIAPLVMFVRWTGRLDEWKGGIDGWKSDVDAVLKDSNEDRWQLRSDVKILKESVDVIKTNVEAIKDELVKSIKNGMVGYHSPFVASPKAIEVLEHINLLTEIDANCSYIVEKVEERSKLPIYSDIKDPERKFIELAPGVIHELIKAGKIEEKKIDIAMDRLEEAFKSGTVGYYAVLLVITAYILEKVRDKGYLAEVSMVYSQIDAMSSESPDDLLDMFGGDLDLAIESYETAVRTIGRIGTDELAEKRLKLAFLYAEAGRNDEALKQLEEAIKIEPGYAGARNNLGVLMYDLKRFDEAEKEYREAIKIKPDYAGAHNNLGNLLRDLNRFDEAEKEWREAIKIKPDFAEAHKNLGVLLRDLNRFDEAEKEWREAIKAKPDFAIAHANLGILLSTLDRQEEAIQEFNMALSLKEQLPDKGESIEQTLKSLKPSHS